MTINFIYNDELPERDVNIEINPLNSEMLRELKAIVNRASGDRITYMQGEKHYYLGLDEVLFFDTSQKQVYAHTKNDIYKTDKKLYQLEEILPMSFMRVSKATIVNTKKIRSITHNITSSSLVEFAGTVKETYVSRQYYKSLVEKINNGGL